jgi:dishevelled associated activator of morphogenesis
VSFYRLQSETDIKVYQQKLREAEKQAEEVTAKLAKKERECEARQEEKEEITNTMNMMKAKLDKEIASHADTRRLLEELQRQVVRLCIFMCVGIRGSKTPSF